MPLEPFMDRDVMFFKRVDVIIHTWNKYEYGTVTKEGATYENF